MVGDANRSPRQSRQVARADVDRIPFDRQVQHLVEIAIVQKASPINRQSIPAHQLVDRRRIEAGNQTVHILSKLSLPQKIVQKSTDGHVRDREQSIEN